MQPPRLASRLWLHLVLLLAAVATCAGVLGWAAHRADGERRRLVTQQTALTVALSSAFARIVDTRLNAPRIPHPAAAPSSITPAAPGPFGDSLHDPGRDSGRDCLPCLIPLTPAGVPATPGDMRSELGALARSAGADAPVIALLARDGELRGLRPDGTVFGGRLLRSDAARLPPHPVVIDPLDLDDHPRTVAAAPAGPGLFLVLGLDLTSRLVGVDQRRWQDRVWALVTCGLLLAAAAGLSATLERTARRRQRLQQDHAALERLNNELTEAHARISTEKADLEATFAAMTDGVAYFDSSQRLVRWNRNAINLTGTPPDAMRPGAHVSEVMRAQALAGEFGPVPDMASLDADLARRLQAFRAASPTRVTERVRPDGQVIELRRTALAGGGNLTVYTDVTARKRADAAQEAARQAAERNANEKARFAAIVSHEIRTPLNVMLASLGLVDRDALPPGQRSLVETGLQAGEALLALLNDILDLSRLESGSFPIFPAPLVPRALVADVARMFRPIAVRRGMRIDVLAAPGIPAHLVADAGRLRQILMNLVGNALKFSRPDRIALVLRTAPDDPAILEIAVQDSGPPIAPADRDHLFRPFSQIDGTAGPAGTGLGLAICAMLAARMGGRMAMRETQPDGYLPGNEFSVSLPCPRAEPAPAIPAEPARRPPRTRILVVEDVDASRWLLATILRRDGHYVEVARSGQEALLRLAAVPFDVLLMDASMPGMDGAEATRRVRALPGVAGNTVVIGVTAFATDADRAGLLAAGMATVLPKPATLPALQAAIYAHVWGGTADIPDAPPAPIAPAVLDPACLAGVPGAHALAHACLDDLAAQQAALADAAATGDAAGLATTAHAMVGAAASHGFAALAATLRRLTTVTTVDNPATDAVAAASAALQATRTALATVPNQWHQVPGNRRPRMRKEADGEDRPVVGATGIEPVTLRV